MLIEDGNWINMVIYPNLISGFMPFVFLLVGNWRKDIVLNFPPYLHRFKIFAVNEFLCFLGLACGVYGLSGLSPVVSTSIGATQPIFMLGLSYFILKHFGLPLKEKTDGQNNYEKVVLLCLDYSWRGVGGAINVKCS